MSFLEILQKKCAKMKIPFNYYSLESFLDYIVENPDKVFAQGQNKRVKGHLLYVEKDWSKIFAQLDPVKFGEITHIVFRADSASTLPVDYYAYQWAPGLIMIFTSSTEEMYERTLQKFIEEKTGISQAWIKPSVLEQLKDFLVMNYEAQIYRFIARRHKFWKVPAQLRPEEDRRISYTGDDAGQTLKEVQTSYGVIPTSIDFIIEDTWMKISRSGLFVLGLATRKTTGILRELVAKVITEQILIRETSGKFNTQYKNISVGDREFKVPQVVAGKILLPNAKLSEIMVRRMFNISRNNGDSRGESEDDELEEDFSFIDTYVQEEPFFFSATVMDELKGTVFGVSGIEKEIALIPKHRTTFETFIKFYDAISDNFDESAKLTTFSEVLNA